MVISIASGKGGTGKTIVATSLALYLSKDGIETGFLDCDVEEPNSSLLLKPVINETQTVGIPVPVIDFKKCTYCGKCAEVCAYHAIAVAKETVLVFPELCHGCGGCTLFCPEEAISEVNRDIGVVEKGNAGEIKFIQGRLNIGEPMAVPLIREVKRHGTEGNDRVIIIDVPPGTSCPVLEAVRESDFVILVTEPTPFGLNDLKLAVETVKKLDIDFGVVINRSDIGDKKVGNYCKDENIPILVEIPYSRDIAVLYSYGISMVTEGEKYREIFRKIWEKVISKIKV
ncbi:MAG: ATP-binding protein [candidate division WOR-3 bacterium]|nr:ATP-binding protein [candidate division WOR-3 bacterium]